MNRKLAAIALFAVVGIAKLPLEQRLSDNLHAKGLLVEPVGIDMRENLGQMGFAASLGGLRSLVASITYLQAYAAFEDVDWGKVDSLMTITTRLQPREATYWDDAAWHQGWNAASHYLRDENLRAALRNKLFRDHVERGIEIVKEGLRFLPNNKKLLVRLGDLYYDRKPDPAKAAEAYLAAYAQGALRFYERKAAYELVKVNDRAAWERAYTILKKNYDDDLDTPSVMTNLPILEARLGIPPEKRVKPGRGKMPDVTKKRLQKPSAK